MILPAVTNIHSGFSPISQKNDLFQMKFSDVSFIVYIYILKDSQNQMYALPLKALAFVQILSSTFSTNRTTLFLSSMTQLLSSTFISLKVSPSMIGSWPLIPTFKCFLSITTVMSLPLSGNETLNGMWIWGFNKAKGIVNCQGNLWSSTMQWTQVSSLLGWWVFFF